MTSTRVPRRRGAIGGLLGTGVLINYVDRINLSVAAPQLQHQFKLGPTQMGLLFSAFFSPTHCCRFQMACFLTASASSWSNAGAPFNGVPRQRSSPLPLGSLEFSSRGSGWAWRRRPGFRPVRRPPAIGSRGMKVRLQPPFLMPRRNFRTSSACRWSPSSSCALAGAGVLHYGGAQLHMFHRLFHSLS
jgi:hypothetical protein